MDKKIEGEIAVLAVTGAGMLLERYLKGLRVRGQIYKLQGLRDAYDAAPPAKRKKLLKSLLLAVDDVISAEQVVDSWAEANAFPSEDLDELGI